MISALFAILLSGILPVTDSASNRVWMESAVQGGEYRNIYDASTLIQGRLGAEGGTSIDRLMLSGRFEYGYNYGVQHTPDFWKVVDSRDAAKMLQKELDEIDGRTTG